MNYIISIYATDYLQLLELAPAMEQAFPGADIKLYGNDALLEELGAETLGEISSEVDQMKESDIIVMLNDMPEQDSFFKSYYGKTVTFSQELKVSDSEDLYYVPDPLISLLTVLAHTNERMAVNVGLPAAVYGKKGVDLLMNETRSIYSFGGYDNDLLPMRIAFNIHLYRDSLPGGVFEKEIAHLRQIASVGLRINPVSTVFVADLFCEGGIKYPEQGFTFKDATGDTSLEDAAANHYIIRKSISTGHATLAGDYLHLRTHAVIEAVGKAAGGLEK